MLVTLLGMVLPPKNLWVKNSLECRKWLRVRLLRMKIASNKSTDEFLAATSPPAGAGGRAAATGFEPPARVAAGRYRVTDSPARSRSYVFYPQILWRTQKNHGLTG